MQSERPELITHHTVRDRTALDVDSVLQCACCDVRGALHNSKRYIAAPSIVVQKAAQTQSIKSSEKSTNDDIFIVCIVYSRLSGCQ